MNDGQDQRPPIDPRRLNAAVRRVADEQGVDPQRVRRHLVFQRVLARIAGDEQWVLKGGFALEVRLGLRARATVDLDLALRVQAVDLRAMLVERLAEGEDGFVFEVNGLRALAGDREGSGWRLTLRCSAQGREVARVRVDVVERGAEVEGAFSALRIPSPVPGLGLDDIEVLAVDVAQHAAEKVHAMERTYAGGLPSSRVKDLLDLVLMVEAGLLPDARWAERLTTVYALRDGTPPPSALPAAPPSWRTEYPEMSTGTGASVVLLEDAEHLVGEVYRDAVEQIETRPLGTPDML